MVREGVREGPGITLLLMRAVISDLVFGECARGAQGVRMGVREGPGITSLIMRAVISGLVFRECARGSQGVREVCSGVGTLRSGSPSARTLVKIESTYVT